MIHMATVTLTLSERHMLSNSIPEGKIFQQQQQKKDIKMIFWMSAHEGCCSQDILDFMFVSKISNFKKIPIIWQLELDEMRGDGLNNEKIFYGW